MRLLYNIAALLIAVLAMPVFLWRWSREAGFGKRMKQMFGFLPQAELDAVAHKQCLWIHAASVGEIVAASPIVKEMHKAFPARPILVTTVTATGHEMAQKIMPDAAAILFFPLDLPWLSASVVNRVAPDLFVLVETELWPNFLQAIARRSVPVVMVNGRISDKSVNRYKHLRSLLREMLATVSLFCMQSDLDRIYVERLGADPKKIVVTGNTKFDQVYSEVSEDEKQKWCELFQLGEPSLSAPVIIAGSTHEGEEEMILTAFQALVAVYSKARLILAPRDIRRAEMLEALVRERQLTVCRRSKMQGKSSGAAVILLDTIGELGRLYSLGDIIFVGGSLIARGGHNVLEPAAHGKPIFVGPHMFNFKDSYALLSSRNACATVKDGKDLGEKILALCVNPLQAQAMGLAASQIMAENRGAAQKSVEYMKRYVE
ncbi:MAG: 3-deoxy-D-manno-octulosonic acid transferase [Sporomusaceae bacterium]|nr:3-deoxy-D-manno-octulosonic acid transferase [Sporomusaceae bacterium]